MAINKVVDGYGQALIDLTGDTVTPADVVNGVTFHDRHGLSRSGGATFGTMINYSKRSQDIEIYVPGRVDSQVRIWLYTTEGAGADPENSFTLWPFGSDTSWLSVVRRVTVTGADGYFEASLVNPESSNRWGIRFVVGTNSCGAYIGTDSYIGKIYFSPSDYTVHVRFFYDGQEDA